MKTKIIYISGNEIFNINDIRSAFNEVRNALNLAQDTVLFGVPIDEDDIGLGNSTANETVDENISVVPQTKFTPAPVSEETIIDNAENVAEENVPSDEEAEIIVEKPVKTRGRPRKNKKEEQQPSETEENTGNEENKIIPILSVLSSKKEKNEPADEPSINETDSDIVEETTEEEIADEESEEITPDESEEIVDEEDTEQSEYEEEPNDEPDEEETITEISEEIFDSEIPDLSDATENLSDSEPDIEKLLSKMPSLNEDSTNEKTEPEQETVEKPESEEDVDATLAKLANEFADAQDSILSNRKNTGGSLIGKLRGRLPFHPKTKDQGISDLFNWGGLAANDEEVSIPGFFTKSKDKK